MSPTSDEGAPRHVIGATKHITIERLRAFSGGGMGEPEFPAANSHTDRTIANAAGISAPVAAGTQVEGWVVSLLVDTFGSDWFRGGRVTVRFVVPAVEGDTLTPHLLCSQRDDNEPGAAWSCEVWCENQLGTRVAVGTATCPAPAVVKG